MITTDLSSKQHIEGQCPTIFPGWGWTLAYGLEEPSFVRQRSAEWLSWLLKQICQTNKTSPIDNNWKPTSLA